MSQIPYGKNACLKQIHHSYGYFIYEKQAFWSNCPSYSGYREYKIDRSLEALETILFNTYVQFNGNYLNKHWVYLWVEMYHHSFTDWYVSWCEYCSITKLVNTNYTLAKKLSYNCRYSDDVCTVNFKDLGTIAKDINDEHIDTGRKYVQSKWISTVEL